MLLTRGPIRVNRKMEVLNNDYDPIKGLYAAGVDIGATDNDTYAGNLPMHSSTWAISSGGIAGESAVEYILTKGK